MLKQMERDKLNVERERLRRSLQKEKLMLEHYSSDLIRAGKLCGNGDIEGLH